MKLTNLFSLIVLFFLTISKSMSQEIVMASVNDRILLQTETPQQGIQWQRSYNNADWEDIPSGNTDSFTTEINSLPVYYRAKIDIENCNLYYSSLIHVYEKEISSDDNDGDGILNVNDNCIEISNANQLDNDNDGIGDVCDDDDDNDGFLDSEDNCPFEAGDINGCSDFDNDGLVGNFDNCPTIYNPDQIDTDNDGIGDLCDPTNNGNLYMFWSNPETWLPNQKPVEGEIVTIPENWHLILDEDTPNLGGLNIMGVLEFKRMDVELKSKWIMVNGTMQIGNEEKPFIHKAIITLTGSEIEADDDNTQNDMGPMGTRGIVAMNGSLEFHGLPPITPWTKISQHAEKGSASLKLLENVNWKQGDEIIVGPTDYYEAGNGISITQKLVLNSVNGADLGLNEGLNAHRWGLLQYATINGVSLDPSNLAPSPLPDNSELKTPKILDERAPVGNLTRNIVVQAPNDSDWQNGFGVHIMIMPNGVAHFDGVEIKRGGQSGRLRRYPFHWHMLSYSGSQTLPDATGQYIKNSSINSSANRGIVIHGTNGTVVQNNIVYDIKGHGIFTEEAAERRNIIDHNLVLHVRNPSSGKAIKLHESGSSPRGSSGLWLSNPDNIITNNMIGDCGNMGYWLAFPRQTFGASAQVLDVNGLPMMPSKIQFGAFENNISHSNKSHGIMIDFPELDEQGNVQPDSYESTTTGQPINWPYDERRRYTLKEFSVWKNGENGVWDRSEWPNNYSAVSADNVSLHFAGSGTDGRIERCLVIGKSLNEGMNGTGHPDIYSGYTTNIKPAFATYHSTFDIKGNLIINFPLGDDKHFGTGVFSTHDYYIRALELGQIRNSNNLIINSHPGYRNTAVEPQFSLSGAIWDPYGVWGPSGNYNVYDVPFFTHGLEVTTIQPNVEASGGVSVEGPFYGVDGFVLHGIDDEHAPYNSFVELLVKRLDNNLNEVGIWHIDGANPGDLLGNMRHFAAHSSGIYEINFPNETLPTDLTMNYTNLIDANDKLLVSVPFDGSLSASVQINIPLSTSSFSYTKVATFQDVRNSEGETYWQDVSNNKVWIKLQGGRWFNNVDDNILKPWEYELYKEFQLRVFQN